MFKKIITFINNNKEWIFDGIGIIAITSIFGIIKHLFSKQRNDSTKLEQINKENSSGTQIGIQNNYYRGEKDNE